MFEPCDLGRDLAALDARADALWADDPALAELCGGVFHAGGKRLRPAFVLLAARFGAADHAVLIDLALATELLHVATLLHDDVVDEATARRHRPSANARFGDAVATYAGSYLFARATAMFARADVGIDPLVSDAIGRLWRGQAREVEHAHNLDVDHARCYSIAADKTGALYELACRAGAVAGGLRLDHADALAAFGRDFGVAFQLVDDVLDIAGDESVLGKRPGSDLHGGVYTLPIVLALEHDDEDARRLREILASDHLDATAVDEAIAILRRGPGIARATSAAAALLDRARAHLAALPEADARHAFCGLTHAVLAPLDAMAACS